MQTAYNRFFAPTIQERQLGLQEQGNAIQRRLEAARIRALEAEQARADELMAMQKQQSAFDMAMALRDAALRQGQASLAMAAQQQQAGQALREARMPTEAERRARLAQSLMQQGQAAARSAAGVDNTAIFGGAYKPAEAALAAIGINARDLEGENNPVRVGMSAGGYVPSQRDILNDRQLQDTLARAELLKASSGRRSLQQNAMADILARLNGGR